MGCRCHQRPDAGELAAGRRARGLSVLVFAVALTFVTGLLFGIAPHGTRRLERGADAGNARIECHSPRLRNPLAAAELALVTVLLIGAGLLTQSLLRLQNVNLGFQPDRLLTFQIGLPPAKYAPEQRASFYLSLLVAARDSRCVTSNSPWCQAVNRERSLGVRQ